MALRRPVTFYVAHERCIAILELMRRKLLLLRIVDLVVLVTIEGGSEVVGPLASKTGFALKEEVADPKPGGIAIAPSGIGICYGLLSVKVINQMLLRVRQYCVGALNLCARTLAVQLRGHLSMAPL